MKDGGLERRVQVLERQISMYERLFETFSAKLDHHFKKYDLMMDVQRQQIKVLTDVFNTMLNDQHRYAGILRNKFRGSLNGIMTTVSSINTVQTNAESTTDTTSDTNISNILANDTKFPGTKLVQPSQQSSIHGDPPRDMTNVDALLGDFIPPQVSTDLKLPVCEHENLSSPLQPSDVVRDDASHDHNLEEEQYYTHRGQKKKRKIYVGKFEFHNSPQSVSDIWKEYTEGHNGQPSIRDMELRYQTSWRRDPAVNKRFHRRKVLCRAIERGLERGYGLKYVIRLLEDCRLIDASRNIKQPIGWLCQNSNIPDLLR